MARLLAGGFGILFAQVLTAISNHPNHGEMIPWLGWFEIAAHLASPHPPLLNLSALQNSHKTEKLLVSHACSSSSELPESKASKLGLGLSRIPALHFTHLRVDRGSDRPFEFSPFWGYAGVAPTLRWRWSFRRQPTTQPRTALVGLKQGWAQPSFRFISWN